jgi:HK97 family phage portal protein
MIIRNLVRPQNQQVMTMPDLMEALNLSGMTTAGQSVTVESAKNVATAYRCINILADDYAKMPEQVFLSLGPGKIERMKPSQLLQNASYLLERSPNRWMTPFKFKRLRMKWLLTHGASYVWCPRRQPGRRRELFILRTDQTRVMMDANGDVWYEVRFSSGAPEMIPGVEVLPLVINSEDGLTGRGIITYARESLGRRLGASQTQAKFYAQGLNPGGIIYVDGDLNKEARDKIRKAYGEAITGTDNAYSLAVMDNKISKFEQITMKPVDVQFLQGIEQNDTEIANYFGMPLYKLNMGKQTYNSNEQANLDYLSTTLDPYLVQTEEVDAQGLLTEEEQEFTYIRFNRDSLLRTDAKTRGETLDKGITSGRLSPNEARQIEDLPAYEGGDAHYIQGGMARIGEDGNLIMGEKNAQK